MNVTSSFPRQHPAPDAVNECSQRDVVADQLVIAESRFLNAIRQERRRSERSGRPFVLMVAKLQEASENGARSGTLRKLAAAFRSAARETDIIGWYQHDKTLGVIFNELGNAEKDVILDSLKQRASAAIRDNACLMMSAVTLTFHYFPEDSKHSGHSTKLDLYPELSRGSWSKRCALAAKRVMDLFVSGLLLVLLLPLLLIIALAIKLTSKGPVLFRQSRIGQHGRPFTFLKFRSMYVNSDAAIHMEYVTRFIDGEISTSAGEVGVYKITNDPRITPMGVFLRKTSLDELPQLLNVLRGEMSLVGPRPPLPYEFHHYDTWHRRRVLEIKPGITGLWQVSGRSRTTFDEMVRLDLQYANEWSLWLDLQILWQTPKAVLFGHGAY
jgi:exopolysaccharide biosynthesis polyprenyl glycosylphosphotransferase